MKLDTEVQRQFLLHLIDNVPVQGSVGNLVEFMQQVHGLKDAISAAGLEENPTEEFLKSR